MAYSPIPVQQHYWEEICCYLLSHMVKEKLHIKCQYEVFGKRGDKQYGIDLITRNPEASTIVGQCKHKEPGKRLEMEEILDTLRKTDDYPENIEHLVFFTNSDAHPKVQTTFSKPQYHDRLNQTKFQVHVKYWSEFTNLRIIPIEKLRQFFPEQVHYAEYFYPQKDIDRLVDAANHACCAVPAMLSSQDIVAIEDSSYSLKLCNTVDDKILDFLQDIDRARITQFGIPDYLYSKKVRSMYRMLPVARPLGTALLEFRKCLVDIPKSIINTPSEIYAKERLQRRAKEVVRLYNAIVNDESIIN